MRSLRKTLNALSPAIILSSVLCGNIWGQGGLTTIQDTLFDADGARYNGTLVIKWNSFDANNPGTIIQQSKSVQVVNGNLLVQLAPNNTAPPPANLYSVLYDSDGNQQYNETWTVPVSTTALKIPQVRTGAGVGSGGSGSAGGLTGTPESSTTNLVSDLNARPIKGPGFGTNAVALINQNGQIETVVGNPDDCVYVDGTTGPCTAGVNIPAFVNGELPVGVVNGLNATFTLANTPSASSLLLFRNGLLVQAGGDYTLTGSTIQFGGAAIPQPLDTLVAQYRVDSGSGSGSVTVTGPSGVPGVNACGAAGVVSKNALYQIVPGDNGYLIIQRASANFTLPVTPPAAGWCIALLDTNTANVAVLTNGNTINGVTTDFTMGPASTTFVISDGAGYWISGTSSATGSSGGFVTFNGQSVAPGAAGNVNGGATAHGVAINGGNGSAIGGTAAGIPHQRLQSAGSSADPLYADDRDVKIIPFGAAPGGNGAGSVTYALGQWAATARAGANNIGTALQATPSTGAVLQFLLELPGDWDPATQPSINIFYGSGANSFGTVVWAVSSACAKADGTVSDDPAFRAEPAFAPQTMAAVDRMWAKGGQFTAVTSANNCVPGGSLIVGVAVSGTAASAMNAYQAVVTIPTLPIAAQAN